MLSKEKTFVYIGDKLRLLLLGCTLFYLFCFQYAIFAINNMLLILGAALVMLEVCLLSYKAYKSIAYIFLFIACSFLLGLLFADDIKSHINLTVQMLEYCIIALSICGYATTPKKLNDILHIISISICLLSLALIVDGVEFTDYGAMTVGELNTNVLSCYLMIGLFAQLLLLCKASSKRYKIILYIFIAIELLAQILAASRRGLVIFVFLLMVYFLAMYFIYFKKKTLTRFFMMLTFIIAVVWVSINFYDIAERFVIFKRFLGDFNTGDELRKQYQAVAKELFYSNPILGQGFGCVAAKIGMYSHSLYYEVLASCGIIGGLLLFIPMISRVFKLFKLSIRVQEKSIKMRCVLAAGCFLSIFLAGIAVVEIFDAYFYILIGLLGAFANIVPKMGGGEE